MDTLRDIIYRGFKLNDASIQTTIDAGRGIGKGIAGSVVDSWDFSDVDVVQFLEKRSLQDGMDAGDVFQGARRLRMAGTLYGKTRGLLYDAYWDLRATLNPVLAQRESPADKGYLPLYFAVPTNRLEDYPDLAIPLRVLALPRSQQVVWQKNQQGGSDADALAIPWQATFLMKDPLIYAQTPIDIAFAVSTEVTGATATASTDLITKTAHGLSAGTVIYLTALTGGAGLALNTRYYVLASGLTANDFKVSLTAGGAAINITTNATVLSWTQPTTSAGNFVNRGKYITYLNMLTTVGASPGTIAITGGGATLTISVPASTGNRDVIYDGKEKVLTIRENSVETVRFDLLDLGTEQAHPIIPPGTSPYTFSFSGVTVKAGSHSWFWETYA